MHYLNVLLDLIGEQERVSVGFRLGENDDFSALSVDDKDVGERGESILEGTLDCQVLHCMCCLILQVLGQIDNSTVRFHVCRGDVSDPAWNRC